MPQTYPLTATRVTYANLVIPGSLGYYNREIKVDSRDPHVVLSQAPTDLMWFLFYDRLESTANVDDQEILVRSGLLDPSGNFFINVAKAVHRSELKRRLVGSDDYFILDDMDRQQKDYCVKWGKPIWRSWPYDPAKDTLLRR